MFTLHYTIYYFTDKKISDYLISEFAELNRFVDNLLRRTVCFTHHHYQKVKQNLVFFSLLNSSISSVTIAVFLP